MRDYKTSLLLHFDDDYQFAADDGKRGQARFSTFAPYQ